MRRILKWQLPAGGGTVDLPVGPTARVLMVAFESYAGQHPNLYVWVEEDDAHPGTTRFGVVMTGSALLTGDGSEHVGSAIAQLPGGPYVVHVYRQRPAYVDTDARL